ncbi:MAG: nucleotidyltransferase [Tissierellaceae bacterium]
MTALGLITEYNPFHLGHKYHLEQSLIKSNADHTIAIMSGSFLQRGEPSLVDKWTRAKMAVDNGIDLVLELPFIFSSQSAERFAYGGIKLLDSLNIVDYVAFGSELGELEPLYQIANILIEEPSYFRERLKEHLATGLSYSVARSNAIEEYTNTKSNNFQYNYKELLNKSNNILGIEYLKAILKIKSNIKAITIRRSGSQYKDPLISEGFASATAIRNSIETKGIESIEKLIPAESYQHIEAYCKEYGSFNSLGNYSQIFQYLLRTTNKTMLQNILDMEKGLENRLVRSSYKFNNINDVIDNVVTKRYPRTRIQRILIHLLNQLDRQTFIYLYSSYPAYIRVLGSNQKGLLLLNKIKKKSSLPIITKFADYKGFRNKALDESIIFDKRATDIFFIGLQGDNSLSNMDYYNSPYIK